MPVNYECDMCFKNFTHKSTFDRHLQRLKPCKPIIPKVVQSVQPIEPLLAQKLPNNICVYCSKHYCNKSSKTKHEKKCVNKIDNFKYKLLEEKLANIELTINEIHQSSQPINSTSIIPSQTNNQTNKTKTINSHNTNKTKTINTNNTNITNITNNTFVLNNYGDENTDYITDAYKIHNIKQLRYSFTQYIIMKHFNKEHPENHNVYISNLHDSYAYKYKNNSWNMIKKSYLISELMFDTEVDVVNNIDDLRDKLDKQTIERFKLFLERIGGEKNTQVKKDILGDIKLILYKTNDIVKA